MRVRTVFLAVVPGAAHVDTGRPGRGLLFFLLFALLANAAFLAPFLTAHRGARAAFALAAAAVWFLAFIDAWRKTGKREG